MSAQAPVTAKPQGALRLMLPVIVFAAGLIAWDLVVRLKEIPPYVLPAPSIIVLTLIKDWAVLSQSLVTTLLTTLEGFIAASIGGIALALLFNQSKWVEYSLFPYAIVLQVTRSPSATRTLAASTGCGRSDTCKRPACRCTRRSRCRTR